MRWRRFDFRPDRVLDIERRQHALRFVAHQEFQKLDGAVAALGVKGDAAAGNVDVRARARLIGPHKAHALHHLAIRRVFRLHQPQIVIMVADRSLRFACSYRPDLIGIAALRIAREIGAHARGPRARVLNAEALNTRGER
jgi:hypothetical protein